MTVGASVTGGAPTGGRAKAAALAVFLGLPLLLLALTIANAWDAVRLGGRIAQQAATLQALERRLAARAPEPAGTVDRSAIYLAGGSETLAQAELQQHLVKLVEQASGRIVEVRSDEASAEREDLTQVQVRLTLDATNDALFDILRGIEAGLPLLTIQEVGIRALPSRDGGAAQDGALRTSLLVTGHWRGTGP